MSWSTFQQEEIQETDIEAHAQNYNDTNNNLSITNPRFAVDGVPDDDDDDDMTYDDTALYDISPQNSGRYG